MNGRTIPDSNEPPRGPRRYQGNDEAWKQEQLRGIASLVDTLTTEELVARRESTRREIADTEDARAREQDWRGEAHLDIMEGDEWLTELQRREWYLQVLLDEISLELKFREHVPSQVRHQRSPRRLAS